MQEATQNMTDRKKGQATITMQQQQFEQLQLRRQNQISKQPDKGDRLSLIEQDEDKNNIKVSKL
ncbi:hypothetical protein WN943_002410 [Citrus x changshan-huyou]